jgi:hypothetical protein
MDFSQEPSYSFFSTKLAVVFKDQRVKAQFGIWMDTLASQPGWRSQYSDWLRAGRWRGRSLSTGRVKISTSPYRPDQLWDPPNLLYNGYLELFPRGKAARA